MKPAARLPQQRRRIFAPPHAWFNHRRKIFSKVEIYLEGATVVFIVSSLHSPLDEGTAIPA
jgi:hypothetical protein